MRTQWIGAVGSLVALIGFTSTAHATATIELLWATSGTTNTTLGAISSSAVLNLVYSNSEGSINVSVSVDYSDLLPAYSLSNFSNNPNGVALDFLPQWG